MTYFKYSFLFFLFFAQQVFSATCVDAKASCLATYHTLSTSKDWSTGQLHVMSGDCSCSPLDSVSFYCSAKSDGFAFGSNCQCQAPYARVGDQCVIQCPTGQVPSASGDGCTFPPNPNPMPTSPPTTTSCPTGQYLVLISGNCETPVTCPSGQERNTTANICASPSATSTNAANACNAQLDICQAAKSISGMGANVACVLFTSPTRGASVCMQTPTSNIGKCTTCLGGTSYDIDPATGNEWGTSGGTGSSSGTGTSTTSDVPKNESDCKARGGTWAAQPGVTTQYGSPVYYCTGYTPSTSKFPELKSQCEASGGKWTETETSGKCETSTTSTGTGTGTNQTNQNPNCGGTTGISCESTQLKLLDSLGNINKTFTDALKVPADFVDCSVGTQCYKDKEQSILDSIKEKTGKVPENVLNMKDLIMGTYLEPLVKDKTSGTCSPAFFEPIVFEFQSIDGKKASYIQPLPGEFLCKLFAIVRIFLVSGAILVGFRNIVFAFVKAT